MAYLCVNKDGQEIICKSKPVRWGDSKPKEETKSPFGTLDKVTGKRYNTYPALSWEIHKVKIEDLYFWKNIINYGGEYHVDFHIELPQGSIEKLIGSRMTWRDKPVELTI